MSRLCSFCSCGLSRGQVDELVAPLGIDSMIAGPDRGDHGAGQARREDRAGRQPFGRSPRGCHSLWAGLVERAQTPPSGASGQGPQEQDRGGACLM